MNWLRCAASPGAALLRWLSLFAATLVFPDPLPVHAQSAAREVIYYYDMTHLYDLDLGDPRQAREAWDLAHLVSSLQGIVNREEPVLFVRFMAQTDDFWFEHLRSPGEWLAGREVVEVESEEELLSLFRDRISGLVVYSEEVAALSNVASTIAGVEDRVCLRFDRAKDSLYRRVMAMEPGWDVLMLARENGSSWFRGEEGSLISATSPPIPSTGSAKGDAYLWAKQRYLDRGKTSDEFLAYYIDQYWLRHPNLASLENFTLTNHDFFISQRAFFFDLGVWADETPVDDLGQPVGTDRAVLEKILEGTMELAGGGILHIGGFTPWRWKYTEEAPGGSSHGAVATEWEKNKVASTYNAVIDSDALDLSGMANASFYQHYPMREHYPQPARPTEETLREAGLLTDDGVAPLIYIMFYHGDYDSAAWLNRHVPLWWKDPARGEVPLNWAFNPNLDRRAPHALDYARRRQTAHEWFIAGDSGAGYLNPGMLFEENRPPGLGDGWKAWVDYCQRYFRKYDLSITGFVIDGASPGMGSEGMDYYMTFSPHGFVGQKVPPQGLHKETMPFIRMGADFHRTDPPAAAARIVEIVRETAGPRFLPLRTILKSPSWHEETMDRAAALPGGANLRFLDAYSFMLLLAIHEREKLERPAPPGPYSDAEELRFDGADSLGLRPAREHDGPFEQTQHQGRPVLRQRSSERVQYLYFRTGDGFARPAQWDAGVDLVVEVSLLDQSSGGGLGLEYNAPGESYLMAPHTHVFTGSGKWLQVTFRLPGARFDHSQNAGASFRLVNFGAELLISEVRVRPE